MGRPSIVETQPVELAESQLLAKILRALGDPSRLRIIEILIERPAIQKELVAELGISQGQVSSHLSCLTWCGLVSGERQGREVEYRIADPGVVGIVDLARSILRRSTGDIAACRRVDVGNI